MNHIIVYFDNPLSRGILILIQSYLCNRKALCLFWMVWVFSLNVSRQTTFIIIIYRKHTESQKYELIVTVLTHMTGLFVKGVFALWRNIMSSQYEIINEWISVFKRNYCKINNASLVVSIVKFIREMENCWKIKLINLEKCDKTIAAIFMIFFIHFLIKRIETDLHNFVCSYNTLN